MPANLIQRLRFSLSGGPWIDGEECVRFIDLPVTACLYDLHESIQAAIEFDNEHPFYFFTAEADGSDRESVPEQIGENPDRKTIDCDIYEDLSALQAIPDSETRSLFYAYMSDGGEWIFQIERVGDAITAKFPLSSYPLQIDSLSLGPNPTQYGHDFDDYADDDDAFLPRRRNTPADGGWDDDGLLYDAEEDDPFADGDSGDDDSGW
ncbi:MAG: hypothetical protein IJS46_01030 [Kiritimatiellae bacterium]|nr:hypothetical protein [Kiritimatiellia bacterium]